MAEQVVGVVAFFQMLQLGVIVAVVAAFPVGVVGAGVVAVVGADMLSEVLADFAGAGDQGIAPGIGLPVGLHFAQIPSLAMGIGPAGGTGNHSAESVELHDQSGVSLHLGEHFGQGGGVVLIAIRHSAAEIAERQW